MVNPYRGEVTLELEGEPHTLRLTLGGLAHLEQALGAEDLGALFALLLAPNLPTRTVALVLRQALMAGSNKSEAEASSLLDGCAQPLRLGKAYVALMRASLAS